MKVYSDYGNYLTSAKIGNHHKGEKGLSLNNDRIFPKVTGKILSVGIL